jgi:hypothetical protein
MLAASGGRLPNGRRSERGAGGFAAPVFPLRTTLYFTKTQNTSDYIYHIPLRHAIKVPVVVASFSPEKRRGPQRILAGRWCESERAARRSSGNSPR